MTRDISWNEYIDVTARIHEANNALARLIADTLTAQYDGAAAYLVLDEESYSGDFIGLVGVLDAEGSCLFKFGDYTAPLPPLPPGSPLADAWGSRDPADPWTLAKAVQGLYQTGAIFDRLPVDRLPLASDSSTAAEAHYCLLLSTAARPDCWDFEEAATARLVRPYSAPRPPDRCQTPLPVPPDSR
ncbi:hypothetical protein [Streptomyces sp. NBC_00687]|uniref:hypothetical protein n=1 Tax=Streptomyces sp. NBC_00687 TaxID=2975807 RepID=UPI00225B54A2|nr:hypothetical protein [Streptomyces sp. NBC_00687]MCX4919847.1 hypothetical protein [Streptomyces sp. NBC_00687]